MRVFIPKLATAALALIYSTPAQAQQTATQIVGTLQSLTLLSLELVNSANTINATNGPLIVSGGGPFPVIQPFYPDSRSNH
jgi:hypothetical protein